MRFSLLFIQRILLTAVEQIWFHRCFHVKKQWHSQRDFAIISLIVL